MKKYLLNYNDFSIIEEKRIPKGNKKYLSGKGIKFLLKTLKTFGIRFRPEKLETLRIDPSLATKIVCPDFKNRKPKGSIKRKTNNSFPPKGTPYIDNKEDYLVIEINKKTISKRNFVQKIISLFNINDKSDIDFKEKEENDSSNGQDIFNGIYKFPDNMFLIKNPNENEDEKYEEIISKSKKDESEQRRADFVKIIQDIEKYVEEQNTDDYEIEVYAKGLCTKKRTTFKYPKKIDTVDSPEKLISIYKLKFEEFNLKNNGNSKDDSVDLTEKESETNNLNLARMRAEIAAQQIKYELSQRGIINQDKIKIKSIKYGFGEEPGCNLNIKIVHKNENKKEDKYLELTKDMELEPEMYPNSDITDQSLYLLKFKPPFIDSKNQKIHEKIDDIIIFVYKEDYERFISRITTKLKEIHSKILNDKDFANYKNKILFINEEKNNIISLKIPNTTNNNKSEEIVDDFTLFLHEELYTLLNNSGGNLNLINYDRKTFADVEDFQEIFKTSPKNGDLLLVSKKGDFFDPEFLKKIELELKEYLNTEQ